MRGDLSSPKTVRLPGPLDTLITEEAEARGIPWSELLRELLVLGIQASPVMDDRYRQALAARREAAAGRSAGAAP